MDRRRSTASPSTLRGCKVCNSAGDPIGTIEDVVLDEQEGRIAYAVLSFGGFPGLGDRLFTAPWAALHVQDGDGRRIRPSVPDRR